jgi:hypothetical protein
MTAASNVRRGRFGPFSAPDALNREVGFVPEPKWRRG